MIRKVHFQNFRCLRDVELTLEPLTVLVGPNSCGKTTVLRGLDARRSISWPADSWQQNSNLNLRIIYQYSNLEFQGKQHIGNHSTATSITRALPQGATIQKHPHNQQDLSLDLKALRSLNTLYETRTLDSNGSNLANVFATLTRQQQGTVAKELCRLVPMFSDVDFQPVAQGQIQFRFQDRWNPKVWLSPEQVSDGTMLLLAFILLQYQNPPPDVITIEEPERALHPYLLEELIGLLRRMTTGEIGHKPVQVVLATHSAELLEYVRPEEVRFLTRSPEDGSVQVNQAATDSPNWRQVYEEYNRSLGGIWLSGGMGGVPGA